MLVRENRQIDQNDRLALDGAKRERIELAAKLEGITIAEVWRSNMDSTTCSRTRMLRGILELLNYERRFELSFQPTEGKENMEGKCKSRFIVHEKCEFLRSNFKLPGRCRQQG
jgi:hypothetical protein